MAATRAIEQLERSGRTFRIHQYDTPDVAEGGYGQAVAGILGVPAARVFKTLVALVDGDHVVAIVPVDRSLGLKHLARTLGGKRAAMADPADAERLTGYVVGGISPFGQRRRMPFVADAAVEGHDTVFVSGGRRGIQIEVAPRDLVELTGARVVAIAE